MGKKKTLEGASVNCTTAIIIDAPEVSHDEQSEDNVIHASVPLELSSKSPS
jgi:hypothetical protein